jgi:hypothetical protein
MNYNEQIIECLKSYLRNLPRNLKEIKLRLTTLGFYSFNYNKRIEYLAEARQRLFGKTKTANLYVDKVNL